MAKIAQKHVFQDQGREYYYWTLGEKNNRWVLLIPGYTSTHSDLLPLGHTFDEKYFVIIPDMPGWGESDRLPTRLHIDAYAKFLHLLMEHMDAKELFLVGYCFGAVIGLTYVLNFPEKIKKIVFISTPYLKGSFINELPFYCARVSTYLPRSMRPLLFLWRNRITAIPFTFLHLHVRSWKSKLRHSMRAIKLQSRQNEQSVEENWTSLAEYEFTNLQRITLPVHLIHGDGDLLVPLSQAKKFQKLFTNTTLDIISGTGHWIPAEKPQTLSSAILKYL